MAGHLSPIKEITQALQSPTLQLKQPTKVKKIFISRNRFEVLSQTGPIEVDTITPNPDSDVNNSKAPTSQLKNAHLPPPIIIKGVKDFVSLRSELIDFVGPDNFTFKSSINSLKV